MARTDTERLDWLESQHNKRDGYPIANLIVKAGFVADSSRWVNVFSNVRGTLDAAMAQEEAANGTE